MLSYTFTRELYASIRNASDVKLHLTIHLFIDILSFRYTDSSFNLMEFAKLLDLLRICDSALFKYLMLQLI